MTCKILGCGGYLPEHVITNQDLEKKIATSDEWIKSRTGICKRHIAAGNEYASHLALKASKEAIKDAKIDSSLIDLIIVSTTTPDNSFPSTATKLQGYLGLRDIPSFDLQAVCSGFIYGLHLADSLIKSAGYNTILLACTEKMSSLIDWNDRTTCVLFGDGAGAVVLQKSFDDSKIIDSKIYSNGSFYDILYTDGGVSMSGHSGKIKMQGPILFKNAVEKMAGSILEILEKNHMTSSDIDFLVPHQANERIIQAIAERIDFDQNKIIKTIADHANCSAASIPLALAELNFSGRLKRGNKVLFTAFGAGLTWGSAIVEW